MTKQCPARDALNHYVARSKYGMGIATSALSQPCPLEAERDQLRAEVARLRGALLTISTGRDEQGRKVDFFQETARAALWEE